MKEADRVVHEEIIMLYITRCTTYTRHISLVYHANRFSRWRSEGLIEHMQTWFQEKLENNSSVTLNDEHNRTWCYIRQSFFLQDPSLRSD